MNRIEKEWKKLVNSLPSKAKDPRRTFYCGFLLAMDIYRKEGSDALSMAEIVAEASPVITGNENEETIN